MPSSRRCGDGAFPPKSEVRGIDGILFYELRDRKKRFYPNKRNSDLSQPISGDSLKDL